MQPQLQALDEGQQVTFAHRITAEEVDSFARVTGDANPLHMDADFARAEGFRDRVVHGAFLLGLVSRLVGMELPTHRTTLLNVTLHFAAATYIGDEVTVTGVVTGVHPAANAVTLKLRLQCDGELRARGSAMVRIQPTAVNV